jgi:TatD DNase family protein
MLIDTHCHLDAAEFDGDRMEVAAQAAAAGVRAIVIPAIGRVNFHTVRDLAHAIPHGAYALGIHPLFVGRAADDDLQALRAAVGTAMDDPRFVAVGEIGLDFFVKEIASGAEREKQERFYAAQLEIAAEFGLPVLLHVRRSQDIVLKYLRRYRHLKGGIAHAFNGSTQQAEAFIAQGCALGIGGAMTFERALQIRHHAQAFGLEHLVLETDSPDIPPAWLHEPDRRNTPGQIPRIAEVLAQLRGVQAGVVAAGTAATALRVLPRLAGLHTLSDSIQ